MSAEAVVGAGLVARSVPLVAFGLDSIVELLSAGVLIWRLTVELRGGREFSEAAEERAGKLAGALLFVLATYVTMPLPGSRLVATVLASPGFPAFTHEKPDDQQRKGGVDPPSARDGEVRGGADEDDERKPPARDRLHCIRS